MKTVKVNIVTPDGPVYDADIENGKCKSRER